MIEAVIGSLISYCSAQHAINLLACQANGTCCKPTQHSTLTPLVQDGMQGAIKRQIITSYAVLPDHLKMHMKALMRDKNA